MRFCPKKPRNQGKNEGEWVEAIGRQMWIRQAMILLWSMQWGAITDARSLDFLRDANMCMWFEWLSGWSPQAAYHIENKHSWLQSTLWKSHSQPGTVTIKLFIAERKFPGACVSTTAAITAATEARVPGSSAVLGLQYLNNLVRGKDMEGMF